MKNNTVMKKNKRNPTGNRQWIPSWGAWLVVVIIVLGIAGINAYTDRAEEEPDGSPPNYGVSAVSLPDALYFAGERMPLEQFDTRESLDRELLVNTYFHSQTLLLIKRSGRYFPVIEPILRKYGVPEDFKYLAIAESQLSNAVSPAGAVGFWQFLAGTAREYGLEVNDEVDERYHLEKSTGAACRYFIDSYDVYGNWTMVAASYNNGRRGLDQQVEIQKEHSYYDLLLNEETARYIFRLAALKVIMESPEKYGFYFHESDLYPVIPTYEEVVDTPVENFADFAKSRGTNYKILKYFNPWLRKPYLSNRAGKSYRIRLPEPGARIVGEAGLGKDPGITD